MKNDQKKSLKKRGKENIVGNIKNADGKHEECL